MENEQKSTLKCAVVVRNTSSEKKKVSLFNTNDNLFLDNFGSDIGVEVKLDDALKTYHNFLELLVERRFKVSIIEISSTNLKQVTQILSITSREGEDSCTIPIITQSYIYEDDMNERVEGETFTLPIPFCFNIDSDTSVDFNILPETEVRIEFH